MYSTENLKVDRLESRTSYRGHLIILEHSGHYGDYIITLCAMHVHSEVTLYPSTQILYLKLILKEYTVGHFSAAKPRRCETSVHMQSTNLRYKKQDIMAYIT